MTRYRLLATDMDGTLFGHDLRITGRTRRAIAALAERGCHFVLATGRMFQATLPFARELGVQTPLITYQGALIRHPVSLEDRWHRTVPGHLAPEAIAALEQAGLHLNLYHGDTLYLRQLGPEAQSYLALARVQPSMVSDWETVLARGELTKIVAIGPEARIIEQLGQMRDRFGDSLFVTQSQPTFLEVANPEISKAEALGRVAAELGVDRSAIVAVGDGLNDLEMIRYAGLGVAMGNGHAELRQAADRMTGRVEEEGLAQLIEALIASGEI